MGIDNLPISLKSVSTEDKINIDRWLLETANLASETTMQNLVAYGYVHDGVKDVQVDIEFTKDPKKRGGTIIYKLLIDSRTYKKYMKYKNSIEKYSKSTSLWGKYRLIKLLKQADKKNLEFNIIKCVKGYLPSFDVKITFVVQSYWLSKLLTILGLK